MIVETLKKSLEASSPAKLALIGIPDDSNSSFFRGSADAPTAIREALFSDAFNMWSETGVDLGADVFAEAVHVVLDHGLTPILLGGDHADHVAHRAGVPAMVRSLEHPALRRPSGPLRQFREQPVLPCSPFARIMENELADRLVQVGIRTATGHEREQAERFGVEIIEMRQMPDDLALEFDGPVYITVDIDGLDPAYAPGVSHPEPGGLSPRQVIHAIQGLAEQIVGADIVEVNPRKDIHNITAVLAAKIVKEIAARTLRS